MNRTGSSPFGKGTGDDLQTAGSFLRWAEKGMSRIRSSRAVDAGPRRPTTDSRRKAPTVARAARSLAASEAEKTALLLRATQRLASVGSMVFGDSGETLEWDEQ